MSFILDALKKSESERQRKAGPALYEVKLAPPRNKLPWWMIGVGALLGINLVFVIWLLLRSPSPTAAANTAAANTAAPAPAPGAGTANTAGTAAPSAPTGPTGPTATTAAATTPAPALAAGAGAVSLSVPSPRTSAVSPTLSNEVPPAPDASIQAPGTGAMTGPAGSNSPLAAGALGTGAGAASDDLAPAVEPERPGSEHVRTTTEAGLPAYKDIAATNSRIPALHLDFHLYAARPQDRFVFINMKKLREGDATPEGVRVESINDEGAVLSFEGTRFTLLHE